MEGLFLYLIFIAHLQKCVWGLGELENLDLRLYTTETVVLPFLKAFTLKRCSALGSQLHLLMYLALETQHIYVELRLLFIQDIRLYQNCRKECIKINCNLSSRRETKISVCVVDQLNMWVQAEETLKWVLEAVVLYWLLSVG